MGHTRIFIKMVDKKEKIIRVSQGTIPRNTDVLESKIGIIFEGNSNRADTPSIRLRKRFVLGGNR